jgi:signal transduction histidine kinase
VIANLLINSVRYTPPHGSVRIDAGADRGEIWLTVSDTCGGIPEADLPRVFDVAFRGESARTPQPQEDTFGGGLGLAIVRGLVEAHGGSVDVDNTAVGCRFEVRLPVSPSLTTGHGPPSTTAAGPGDPRRFLSNDSSRREAGAPHAVPDTPRRSTATT